MFASDYVFDDDHRMEMICGVYTINPNACASIHLSRIIAISPNWGAKCKPTVMLILHLQ
jgi:hypothetical protein